MTLIKEPQGAFFYDPNDGVELIKENVSERVEHHLDKNHDRFNLDTFSFYTLEEEAPFIIKKMRHFLDGLKA